MERWIINPHTVNAAYATFVREHYWNFPSSLDKNLPATLGLPAGISPHVFPKFSISNGVSTSLGPETYSGGVQNVFTYSDVLSWTKGRHSFSAGGLFNKSQVNKPQVWGGPTFTFNGQYTGNGFADFLLGDVQQYQYKATLTEYGERHTSMAAFIQDDWKVLHNLTLNLGLRYQYEGGFSEHKMQNANFSPTLNNPLTNTPGAIVFANSSGWILQQDHRLLFAPRIGLAESIGQKTVVRGGFGLFNQMADAQRGANEGPPGICAQSDVGCANAYNSFTFPTPGRTAGLCDSHRGRPNRIDSEWPVDLLVAVSFAPTVYRGMESFSPATTRVPDGGDCFLCRECRPASICQLRFKSSASKPVGYAHG